MKQYTLKPISPLASLHSPIEIPNRTLYDLFFLVAWRPEEFEIISDLEVNSQAFFTDFAVRRTQ